MSIRFKFRSSVQFDSIEIDNRPSISVRELRSKIILQKKLNSSEDFDLVFSDASTGKEYTEESVQILSGSNVIIKRVPAGVRQSASRENNGSSEDFRVKIFKFDDTIGPVKKMQEIDEYGDFGSVLCPVSDETSFECELDQSKNYCANGDKTDDNIPRCSGVPLLRCQLLDPNEADDALPNGLTDVQIENNSSLPKLHRGAAESSKEKVVATNPPPYMQTSALPAELKCPLCDTFFETAMMIPCCQHSFCEKCIRLTLVEKARCPKCYSTKFGVADLLPNVSLRKAIFHFLNSQALPSVSEQAFHRDAPDEESGIQAIEISRDISIMRKEPNVAPFSATGMGTKRIVAESVHKEDEFNLHMDVKNGPRDDFQGESQPVYLPQTRMHEVGLTQKRKREHEQFADGAVNYMETGRHKKDNRTCYMCGSPDHLIRDCPTASCSYPPIPPSGNPMFSGAMPGYGTPYWNPSLAHNSPFVHSYCNPGMMPFNNANMVPTSPFAVSPYMTSIGYMRMGGLASPMGTNASRPPSHLMVEGHQEQGNNWKHAKDNMGRKHSYDDDLNKSGRKFHRDREQSLSCSEEDSFVRKSQRKHYNDDSCEYKPRSSRSTVDKSNSSNHHRESKKYNESHSIQSHHKKSTQREHGKGKEYNNSYRISRHKEKYKIDHHDRSPKRWKMGNGLDDDCEEDFHHRKRKRDK